MGEGAWDQGSWAEWELPGERGMGEEGGTSGGAAHRVARQRGLGGTHSGCRENRATRLSTRDGGRRQAGPTWTLCPPRAGAGSGEVGTHLPDAREGADAPTSFPPRAQGGPVTHFPL